MPRLHNPLFDCIFRIALTKRLEACGMIDPRRLNGGVFAVVIVAYDISHLPKLTEEELHRHRAAEGIINVVLFQRLPCAQALARLLVGMERYRSS